MEQNEQEKSFLKAKGIHNTADVQLGLSIGNIDGLINLLAEHKAWLIEQGKKGKLTLQECKNKVARSKGYPDYETMDNFIIDHDVPVNVSVLINASMTEAAEMYANQIPVAPAEKWISVKDRPPEVDQKVSVLKNGKSDFALYGEDIHGIICFTGLDFQCDFGDNDCPTHWMPLPAALTQPNN
jgi:hypothetical protein